MKLSWPSFTSEKLVRIACILGLIALPLMVWSVFDPRVWPVLGALSIGQVIGTTSFALYLIVVIRDLGVVRRLRGPRRTDRT
jgi:predicted small integral membrane protein